MKTLNHLLIAAIATTAITSCNNELKEQSLSNNSNVNFFMGIGTTQPSRTVMEDESYTATFSTGDAVGIFVKDVAAYSNVKFTTTDGTNWSGSTINIPEGTEYTYYAYYPYAEGYTTSINYTIATDQNAEGFIKNDFLYSTATSGNTIVTLPYSHALSLVEVTLAGPGAAEGATVNLLNVSTDATIDLTAQTVSTGETKANVTMDALEAAMKYRAIIPAQKITASTPAFQISSAGKTYQAKYSGEINFEQGKYLAMTITLGGEGGDAEITLDIDSSINDWTEGTDNSGEASIDITGMNIPLPTDGKFTEWRKGWSNSTASSKIPSGGESMWYNRINVVDSLSVIPSYDSEEAAILFTNQKYTTKSKVNPQNDSIAYSKGAWNNNCIVYHCTTPIDTAYYKISFKVKGDIAGGTIGLAITNSTDDKLFPLFQSSNGAFWDRSVTTFAGLTTEWTEKSAIFGANKTAKEGKSSGITASSLSTATLEDVNKGFNIILHAYKDGMLIKHYVKDIKFEKYDGPISYKKEEKN